MSSLANKLHTLMLIAQVSVANCQSKFAVHEVMNRVANLKVHLRACTGNVNIRNVTVYTEIRLNNYT